MGYVNTAKALLDKVTSDLIEQNNEIALELQEAYPPKKNTLSGEEHAGVAVTFVIHRDVFAVPNAVAAIKSTYGGLIDLIGFKLSVKLEANSNRFDLAGHTVIEDIDQGERVINPIHIDAVDTLNPLSGRPELTSERYTPLEQHQSSLRMGGSRPSVALFFTSDPVLALKYARTATTTRRGLGYIVCFDPEGQRNNGIPSVGSDLETNYSLNVFLNSLKAAIANDVSGKEGYNGIMR